MTKLGQPQARAAARETRWRWDAAFSSLGTRSRLWIAFGLVHLMVCVLALFGPGWALGDVEMTYYRWTIFAEAGLERAGIDAPWVYPILAFLPMKAASLLPVDYVYAWLGIVTAVNASAFAVLLGRGQVARSRAVAGGFWLGFIALLGPVSLGRIDSVTVPLVMMGLLVALRRPEIASALLVFAAWMKVWPGAVWAALLMSVRARARVVAVAVALSGIVVAGALVSGSGSNVFSFITEQGTRNLQVESMGALPLLWAIALGNSALSVDYNRSILTFEVFGPGSLAAAEVMAWLMPVGVMLCVAAGGWAIRRGADTSKVLPAFALAFTAVLIVTNKVGSPQYVAWLAPAVVMGLVIGGARWNRVAVVSLAVALLTQLIYPYLYGFVLAAHPLMLGVMTLRAVLEIALVVIALRALLDAGRKAAG